MSGITPFTIYNCKRMLDQKSPAQLVVLKEDQAIIKYVNGLFCYCKVQEIEPYFKFKVIERIDTYKESKVGEIRLKEGIYKVEIQNVNAYLIVFKDKSGVVYILDTRAIVFWRSAEEMIANVVKSSLLFVP